jgi:TetR/AcrR family tetracycline transcriptional repressor
VTLDRQRIVAEAIALLDADGLDGLTLRKLAARLGVRQPTLYWHLPNKAALITAIADAILDEQFATMAPPGPDERWQDWLIGLAATSSPSRRAPRTRMRPRASTWPPSPRHTRP